MAVADPIVLHDAPEGRHHLRGESRASADQWEGRRQQTRKRLLTVPDVSMVREAVSNES